MHNGWKLIITKQEAKLVIERLVALSQDTSSMSNIQIHIQIFEEVMSLKMIQVFGIPNEGWGPYSNKY